MPIDIPLKIKGTQFQADLKNDNSWKFVKLVSIVSVIFFSFVTVFCKANITSHSKNNSIIRLIDILPRANLQGKVFDQSKDLVYHWKKNPNRYSELSATQKGLNLQMTFNTNKNLYVNHSQNSIVLTPDSKLIFNINPNKAYSFEMSSGVLPSDLSFVPSGKLEIYQDDNLVFEKKYSQKHLENWNKDNFFLPKGKKLQIVWNSDDTFLFLGNPTLYPKTNLPKSNIILIVVDAVRRDSLGFYGCQIPTSPNLDELAKESIVFDKAFSNANWTKPSMISMFHGDYTSNLGIINTSFEVYRSEKQNYYSSPIPNLINILKQNEYFTASIMNNVFLLEYTGVGVDLGFQELVQIGKDVEDTQKITQESISFLQENQNKPFFLHINYNTPHGPYLPPLRILRQIQKESDPKELGSLEPFLLKYYGEIRYADQEIGKVLTELKSLGLYDNSYVIITADHGELLDVEHTFESNGISGVKHGHGETHYDEELMVPWIIKPPKLLFQAAQKKKIKKQSSLVSVLPTILGFLSIPFEKKDYKGVDYSDCILNAKVDCPVENVVYSEGRQSESFRTSRLKYIRRFPGYSNYHINIPLQDYELEEIYDLKNDPLEHNDLSSNPELLKEARKLSQKHSLNKNSFRLFLPGVAERTEYFVNISANGGVYQIVSDDSLVYESMQKNKIAFRFQSNKHSQEIKIQTIQPDYGIQLNIQKNGKLQEYKIGKWGLIGNQFVTIEDARLIASHSKPFGLGASHYPWIYNDSKFFQNLPTENKIQLGDEIKNILKSWGYIHK